MMHSVAVLGAGTMGAQIAAHAANAGLSVLLLDVTADAAQAGLERARRLKPDPFFLPDAAALIRTGSFDDLLAHAGRADWVIEAIVEQLEPKHALLSRLAPHLAAGTIVTTNTSGIPIAQVAQAFTGAAVEVRRRFLGTHFFNPPRYLPLVELIPTAETDPAVLQRMRDFLDVHLGKGVVVAHDRPGFIANRIGIYGMARTLELVADGRFTIDEVDALTGAAIGRPKSATFRTADIAGIDILARVASDLETNLKEEAFRMPPFVEAMVAEGALGEKAGRGFFQKVAGAEGSEIHVRDIASSTYVPRVKARFASMDAARSVEDVRARVKALFLAPDRAGEFLRATLGPTLLYAARIAPEVADSIDDIDRAMRWGFAWELGPFETWDAIGIQDVLRALNGSPTEAPPIVAEAVVQGRNAFREAPLQPVAPEFAVLRAARAAATRTAHVPAGVAAGILESQPQVSRPLKANAAASLVDLGDGVLALNFHSKMNAIGGDTMEMLEAAVATASSGYRGLVLTTKGPHFSAGANLMLLLLAAQEGEWDDIDLMVRTFQRATMTLRRSPVPVVSAIAGMALGGGCEIGLHCDRVQAAGEAYIGLVEVGVGLIPAGGGTKEMLARAMEAMPDASADLMPHVQRVFETIGFGKVSTSGPHARRLGYLREVDGVTMNRERVLGDAKRTALARAAAGYHPPPLRPAIPVGGPDVYAALALGIHLARRAERISDHDAVIGRHLARILTGGDVLHRTTLSEQQLLDLEREAFLKLTGERKTLERIGHTLKTGKMLRN
ncbi:MAG TPA: 3-hydroxyacyl-CoA dehydrogenase NAD-binding domain-containing protein [Vicinamibacterales bacterium]|nr:3-hydroxyacyl-CoA dehydrogenase NAD-binding domain-containing protein [Vicinamibacterales bacterium]